MNTESLNISGAWIINQEIFEDDRGNFGEWFRLDKFESNFRKNFLPVQANFSSSKKGVLRGIHYSLNPDGQEKWITCINGSCLDVLVDLRTNSPTFRKWCSIKLVANSGQAIYISSGIGHAFLALENSTSVSYLLSTPYKPEFEFSINPFDTNLEIDWQFDLVGNCTPILSQKDSKAPNLTEMLLMNRLHRII